MKKEYKFTYEIFDNIQQLSEEDRNLIERSRENTAQAYAPYSSFQVSAVGLLANGEVVSSTNQENASYPVGICAERTLLSAIASVHPRIAVKTIAISYHNLNGQSIKPLAPCGMCRQALLEQENRFGKPIRILMSGMEGAVIILGSARELLPLDFSAADMR